MALKKQNTRSTALEWRISRQTKLHASGEWTLLLVSTRASPAVQLLIHNLNVKDNLGQLPLKLGHGFAMVYNWQIWMSMMTSSNRNIFRVTDHLCGELVNSPHKGK